MLRQRRQIHESESCKLLFRCYGFWLKKTPLVNLFYCNVDDMLGGFKLSSLVLFSKSLTTLKKLKIDKAKVCLSVCLSVFVSLASDSSETYF